MRYVKASDGTVLKYPYRLSDLRADYPGTSFPKEETPELMAEYGIFPVYETGQPSVTIYERAAEADWTSGAFDAAAFGFTSSDSTQNSWCAMSIALRPA